MVVWNCHGLASVPHQCTPKSKMVTPCPQYFMRNNHFPLRHTAKQKFKHNNPNPQQTTAQGTRSAHTSHSHQPWLATRLIDVHNQKKPKREDNRHLGNIDEGTTHQPEDLKSHHRKNQKNKNEGKPTNYDARAGSERQASSKYSKISTRNKMRLTVAEITMYTQIKRHGKRRVPARSHNSDSARTASSNST